MIRAFLFICILLFTQTGLSTQFRVGQKIVASDGRNFVIIGVPENYAALDNFADSSRPENKHSLRKGTIGLVLLDVLGRTTHFTKIFSQWQGNASQERILENLEVVLPELAKQADPNWRVDQRGQLLDAKIGKRSLKLYVGGEWLATMARIKVLVEKAYPNDYKTRFALTSEVYSLLPSILKLHELGYLHTDIKPSNILVYPDGSLSLTDHETVRFQSKPKSIEMDFIGTPAFAPPEVLHRIEDRFTPQYDYFSFGVILANLLHPMPGYRSEDFDSSSSKKREVFFSTLRSHANSLDAHLRADALKLVGVISDLTYPDKRRRRAIPVDLPALKSLTESLDTTQKSSLVHHLFAFHSLYSCKDIDLKTGHKL